VAGLTVETDRSPLVACRRCGVLAADHGRREHRLADARAFGTPVQLIWRERRWRCREPRAPPSRVRGAPGLAGASQGDRLCEEHTGTTPPPRRVAGTRCMFRKPKVYWDISTARAGRLERHRATCSVRLVDAMGLGIDDRGTHGPIGLAHAYRVLPSLCGLENYSDRSRPRRGDKSDLRRSGRATLWNARPRRTRRDRWASSTTSCRRP